MTRCLVATLVVMLRMASSAISGRNFARLTAAAIRCSRPLDLRGRRVELEEPLVLKGDDSLCVANGTVVGSGHAVFQAGGSRSGLLSLRNLNVLHLSSAARLEKRALGAAIFARGKAQVRMEGCAISSTAGFGLWLVQKSHAVADACRFEACGRSSVVAFEKTRFDLVDSTIVDATPHGICARGDAAIRVVRSRIENADLRAIYCYHSVALEVEDSAIFGTRSSESCAIQIDALRSVDAATLVLSNTKFEGNAGGDLDVKGTVSRDVRCDNVVERSHDFALRKGWADA
ncbi:hypothetical protein M885DRAFT_525490 [Pelagophyceae sp. CCMP2097]|nr:hypothetical protein M885DRAFT_525490 [Pelagophyceae sp. CCMP2097]